MELEDKHREILEKYPRAIVHMRAQLNREKHRFGLVFGSGLSKSFGLPMWKSLVTDIANDEEIGAGFLLGRDSPSDSLSYITEMIYQHYKKRKIDVANQVATDPFKLRAAEFEIAGQWIEIIRRHLYKGVNRDFKSQIDQHPYFKKLIPIIKKSQMTVTYNFDDYIERSLVLLRDDQEKSDSKGYEVVTTPWTQFRRENAVIYHPNGIVPYENMEVPSDRIIFSESTFADQILGQSGGEDVGLLSHLSKNTCLFVGLSLQDETLRGLLSKSAKKNPGSYHYYIMYMNGDDESSEHQQAIRHTNFQVYNLITLFLDDKGIAALSDLISVDDDDFKDFAAQHAVEINYRFYLTGPLGVGKSTTIHHVRNLLTYDEWLEQRISILAKPWDLLTEAEKIEADSWILNQFKLKNKRLRHDSGGVFVIDRGPMDPIAFTPDSERKEKAKKLIEAYSPGQSNFEVMPGTLLFLEGNVDELEIRLKMSNREAYTADRLRGMVDDLLEVYGEENVRKFDTTGMSVEQMVKSISEIIHLHDYQPMDMQTRLQKLAEQGEDNEDVNE